MLSVAQYSWLMLLVPLAAGIALAALDRRLSQRAALGIAIGATVIAFLAALAVAGTTLGIAPQLVNLISFGSRGIVLRIDSFAAYCLISIIAWVAPVLIWMTAPRGPVAAEQAASFRPMGLALIAVSLALGAVLLDNVLLLTLCWSGVGFVAWLMARPEGALRPSSTQEWIDLPLLTAGPILFVLAMIFPMVTGKTLSLFDMTGHPVFGFWTAFLLIAVLAVAAAIYPFISWVRRVAQGVLPEAVGVLLLLLTPLAVVVFGRMLPTLAPGGTWPTGHAGPITFPVNVLSLILGVLTVVIAGIVLLFERDLLVISALLSTMTLGWCFAAYGTNDPHALVGVTLLLFVQTVSIGALMAIWSSLEWAGRDLRVEDLAGLARDLPGHFAALGLAMLSLVGTPLLAGFAGMATIDQGIIGEGGTAALGGALIWIGNALALLAVVRVLARALTHVPGAPVTETRLPETWETIALMVPAALLLLFGIAPELLFIGKAPIYGPAVSAAAAMLPNANQYTDVTVTPLGYNVGSMLWIPGVFWALAIVATAIVVLCAGLINNEAAPSPVFAGGEPLSEEPVTTGMWNMDLLPIALSPVVLPGPRSWRADLADDIAWDQGDEEPVEVVEEDEEIFILDEPAAEGLDEDAGNTAAGVDEVADSEDDETVYEEEASVEEVPEAEEAATPVAEAEPEIAGETGEGDTNEGETAQDVSPAPPARPAPPRPASQTPRPRQTGKGGKKRGKH